MKTDLGNLDAWERALTTVPHDVFHLPAYVAADASHAHGSAEVFLAEDRGRALLIPLVLRPVPGSTWLDAVSPYGYSGPVSNTTDPSFWEGALESFVGLLSERRVVSCLLRLHPILPAAQEHIERIGALVRHGDTVSLDLTADWKHVAMRMRANHRRDIRRACAEGVTTTIDDWTLYPDFVSMYAETMDRVGATADYRFSADHVLRLRHDLGDAVHLITVLDDGQPIGAGIFFDQDGVASYYLGCSRTAAMARAPSKVLIDAAWRFAKMRGNRTLHLGGGLHAAPDSLFQFKAGFSDLRHPFHTARIVCDAPEYARLCDLAPLLPDADPTSGFFPAYRRPRDVSVESTPAL